MKWILQPFKTAACATAIAAGPVPKIATLRDFVLMRLLHHARGHQALERVMELPVGLDQLSLQIYRVGKSLQVRELVAVSVLEMRDEIIISHFVRIDNKRDILRV